MRISDLTSDVCASDLCGTYAFGIRSWQSHPFERQYCYHHPRHPGVERPFRSDLWSFCRASLRIVSAPNSLQFHVDPLPYRNGLFWRVPPSCQPVCRSADRGPLCRFVVYLRRCGDGSRGNDLRFVGDAGKGSRQTQDRYHERSEEHTSELQSLMPISYAVFCLKTTQYRN